MSLHRSYHPCQVLDYLTPQQKGWERVFMDEQVLAGTGSGFVPQYPSVEQRLARTRALKQGMMQELLTGRPRLL